MSSFDIGDGFVLKQLMLPAMHRSGYPNEKYGNIGRWPGWKEHIIVIIVKKVDWKNILISIKLMHLLRTDEENFLIKVICLTDALLNHPDKFITARLVLGVDAWPLRNLPGRWIKKIFTYSELVNIVTLEKFISIANQSKL